MCLQFGIIKQIAYLKVRFFGITQNLHLINQVNNIVLIIL